MKKMVSVLITLILLLGAMPTPALADTESVTEVEAVTSLPMLEGVRDVAILFHNQKTSFPAYPRTNICLNELGAMYPDAETLSLHFSSNFGYYVYAYIGLTLPEHLRELTITCDDQPTIPQQEALAYLLLAAKQQLPGLLVNSQPLSKIDPLAGLSKEDAKKAAMAATDVFLTFLVKRLQADRIPAGQGEPKAEGKLLIYIYQEGQRYETSAERATPTEDFYGFPAANLAQTVEECDRVAIVYPIYIEQGQYTDYTKAYGTKTMLALIDVHGDTMYDPIETAYTEPKQVKEGFESGYGDFLPEEAIAYLAALLP